MIIELFSGLGRFETDEDVICIGIQRETRPTICADVRFLPLRPALKPRLLHGSPPCKYFSYARLVISRKRSVELYEPEGIADSLRLVAAFFDAVGYLEPASWTLENPLSLLGKFLNESLISYEAGDYKHKRTNFWSNSRSLKRAIIPKDVRNRLLELASEN